MNETKFRCFRCGDEIEVPETLETAFCLKCQQQHTARGFSRYMLEEDRQHIIKNVKTPLVKSLITLVKRIREKPTKDNTHKPNTHVWIDIKDWFSTHEDNPTPSRQELFQAIWKLWIGENEHDVYYENRVQRILEKWLEVVLEGRWQPRDLDYRLGHWKEEEPGKGYQFIKECYEQGRTKSGQLAKLVSE